MSNSITCKRCNTTDDYRVEQKGPHQTAICNGCGKYIKHLPQNNEARLYVGKYSGQLISEIKDVEYLHWVWDNVKLSPRLLDAIDKQIQSLYNSAP